ncbi:uncharacterized protein [Procambarus clarkii]|uniref:uncharacterized protein n=1 Tax=Procambarus clarkii TaxID=6728 RepID=UPI00374327C5
MKIYKHRICEEEDASRKNTEYNNCLANSPKQTPGDSVDVVAPEPTKKNSHKNNSGTICSETIGNSEEQYRKEKSSEKDTHGNDAQYDSLTDYIVSNDKIKQEVDEQLDESIDGTNLVSRCGLDKSGYSLCSNQNNGDHLSLISSENDKGPYKKPHKCDQCETSFRTPYELERHGRIHSGERPFKCQLCDMCFKRKDHVEVHMRRHIEDRRHVCDICGMWFVTSSCLLRHRRRTHQVFDPPSNTKPKHQQSHFETEYLDDARCGVTEQILSLSDNQSSLNMERSRKKCKRPKSKAKVDSTYRPGGKTVCILKKRKLRNRSYSFAELEDDIECFETDEEDTIPYLKIQTKSIKQEDDNMITEVCELEHSLFPTGFFSHAAPLDHMLLMGEVSKLLSDRSIPDFKENEIEDCCASDLAVKSGYSVSKQNEQADVPNPGSESEESEVPLISCDVSFDEPENEFISTVSKDSKGKKKKSSHTPRNAISGTGDEKNELSVDTLNKHLKENTTENDSNKILDKIEKGTSTEDGEKGTSTEDHDKGTSIEDGEKGTNTEDGEKGTSTEDGENGTGAEDGEKGMSTEDGEKGITTEDGEKGITTEDGEQGISTEDGEMGTSIEDGEMGTSIEDGEKGTRFEDGEKGISIEDGEKGTSIEDGEKGTSIEDGEKGTSIEDGEKGTSINDSEKGTSTDDGEKGTSTEDGEKGTSTEDGEKEMTTEDGEKGTSTEYSDTGTSSKGGEKGTSTEDGEKGITTEDGEKGTSTEYSDKGTSFEGGETGTTTEDGEKGMSTEDDERGTSTQDYNSVESDKIQVVEEEHALENNEQYSQLLKIICQSLTNRSQAGGIVPSEHFQDSTSALTESQISGCLTQSVVSRSRRSIWQNYNFRKKSFNNRRFLYMRGFKEDPEKMNPYKKPHKCHLCDLYFRSPSELKRHARIHSGERPYLCELCGSGFIRKCHLQLHVRRHTGERRHACRECGMKFFTTSDLNRHMLIHKTNKPFKCHICTVTYRRASHLEQHIRNHVNATPFMCHLCGTFFTTSASLKKHEKHHFSIDPYSCSDCSASFTTSTSLSKHRRVHTDPHYNFLKICLKGMKISDQYECISSEGSPLSLVIRRVAGRAHLKIPEVETCVNDNFNTKDVNEDDITKQYISGWESHDRFHKKSPLQNGSNWSILEKQVRNAGEDIPVKSSGLHDEGNSLHDEGNGLHDEGNGLHDEGNGLHDEGNGLHDEGNSLHDEGNGLHDEGNGLHDEGNGLHDEGNGLHDEVNGHREKGNVLCEKDNRAHEEDNHVCEKDNRAHEEDNHVCEKDNRSREENNHVCEKDNRAREEDNHVYEKDNRACEEDNHVCEKNNGVHEEGNNLCGKEEEDICEEDNGMYEKANGLCKKDNHLYEKCNDLYEVGKKLHEDCNSLPEEHSRLHKEHKDVHEDHNNLQEECSVLHDDCKDVHKDHNGVNEECSSLHEEHKCVDEEHNGLHEERKDILGERNVLHEEHTAVHKEHNGVSKECNGILEKHNDDHEESSGLRGKCNGLHIECNDFHEEQDGLHEEGNDLHVEQDGLHEEGNDLHEAGNDLRVEQDGLHVQQDSFHEEGDAHVEQDGLHVEQDGLHEEGNDLQEAGNDLHVRQDGLHEEGNDLQEAGNDLHVEQDSLHEEGDDHVEQDGLHEESNGLHVEQDGLHEESNGLHEKSNHFANEDDACLTKERYINNGIDVPMKDNKPFDFEHDIKSTYDKTGDTCPLIKLSTPGKSYTNNEKNIQSQDCQTEKVINKALLNTVNCTEVLTKTVTQNAGNSPIEEFTTFGSCMLQAMIDNNINNASCSKLARKCIPNEENYFVPNNMIKSSDRKSIIYNEDVDSTYFDGDTRSMPETINCQEAGAEMSRASNLLLLKNNVFLTEKKEVCMYKNNAQNKKELHNMDAILKSQGKTSSLMNIYSKGDCLVKEIETVYQDVEFNMDDISRTSEEISPQDSCVQSIKNRKLALNKLGIGAEHKNVTNLDKYLRSLSRSPSYPSRHERQQSEDTRGLHTDDETTKLFLAKTVPTSTEFPHGPLKLSWPKPLPVLPILFNDGQKSMTKGNSVASDMKKDEVGEFSDDIHSLLSKEKQKDDRLKQSCARLSPIDIKRTAQQKPRKRSLPLVNEGYEINPELSTRSVTKFNEERELPRKSKHLAFAPLDKFQKYTRTKPLNKSKETSLQSVKLRSFLSLRAQEHTSDLLAERQHLILEPPAESQKELEHKPTTMNCLLDDKYGNTDQDLFPTSFLTLTNQVREAQCIPSIYEYMSGIPYGRLADMYSLSSHILGKPQESHLEREILAMRENYMNNSLNFQISNILALRSCTARMASSSTCPSFNHNKVNVD